MNIYSKYAKFIVNELMPRSKKAGISLDDFIPSVVAFQLIVLEQIQRTTRHQTREFLAHLLDVQLNVKSQPNEASLYIIEQLMTTKMKLISKV